MPTPQNTKTQKSPKGAPTRAPFGLFHYIFLSFDRSGSHAFHVEALHEDEQDRNRDGNQHATGGERHEQRVGGCAGHHREQADRYRVVRDVVAHDDFCEDEVHPRPHEGQQRRVHDDRFGQRQRDFRENLPLVGAVDHGGFIQRHRDRIKESFGDVEAQRGARGIDQNQSKQTFGQVQGFQDVVHGNHAHESGEHVQHQGNFQERFPHLEAQARQCVCHCDRDESRQDTADHGNEQRVQEPAHKRIISGGVLQQNPVVLQSE